ncbi:MAG: hypothetical protein K0S26_2519, partial [Bacteroidota bacterium]|nr:hypothetical protein [Bacteroidota bacterium]
CDQTKLIVGGTDNLRGAIFDINTTNGAVLSTKIVAYGGVFPLPSIQEVRSITSCGNGRYYFLTLDSIGYINQNLTACSGNSGLYKTTSTHGLSYKCENYRDANTGIMAIRADVNFVYTHNGTTLFKRSLANASIISSVAIPGGASTTSLGKNIVGCSGIDIDAAGNIYVGSTNAVTKFSPALVQLATVAVPFNVYDVHVSTSGDVIACGSTGNSGTSSRTGYIQSLNTLTAGATLSLTCCDANICPSPNICSSAAAFNLTATTPGGTWSGTGITNATNGTFNPATAGVGSHVITYSLTCGVGTTTIIVSPCATLSVCLESNGSITVSNGVGPYTWATFVAGTSSPITNQAQCQACGYTWFGFPLNQCVNGATPVTSCTTAAGWSNFATGTNTTLPGGATQIKITDAAGTTITFTPGTIPNCTTTSCPTLTMAVSSQTNVNCFGASTGTAAVSTTGGAGSYSYTWSPGNLTGASQSALTAGTYTIAISDANQCTGTGTVTITQPTAALNAVISSTAAAGCGASTGGATVTPSGGTSGYTYSWAPSGGSTAGVSNLNAGSHTVTVTDAKGCAKTAVATISSSGGLSVSVASQTNINCFGANTGTATVNASGGTGTYNYTWTPGNLTGASQTSLAAGTYTINASDANSCVGSATLTITQPTSAVSAVITATTAASCGSGTTSTVFWTEAFGTGCNQGALASAFTGTNGAWAVTNTGTNDPSANQWYVSATESGMGVGNCGDGCLGAGTTNRTLHVANVSTSPAAFLFCPSGDCGAAYDTGLGTNAVSADKRAESPTINCTGQSNITLNFKYIEGGETPVDDAPLWYFNGTVWAQIDNMPKTVVCGGSQGQWASRTIALPASANNNAAVKIGYRWVNNDNGAGADPSFAVDDMTLTSVTAGGGTGGATVTASGGTPGYNYNWSPAGGTTAGVTGLNAGSNTVTVTDANGCTATAIANITSAGGPTLSVSSQANVNCFGANTGTATVAGSGGTGSYTYTWAPGNLTGASQTSLSAGTYTINVADANSCVGSGTLTIAQPTAALSAIISATSAAGCGASTGGATVTASGGTPAYSYSWSPGGGTTAGVSNLAAGSNSVTVTDIKGCAVIVITNITTSGGPTLSVVSQASVNCFGSNTGTATINAAGGGGSYSYTWSPGNLTGATQNSLTAGVYTITIKDATNCTGTGTLAITQPTAALSAPISNSPTGCGTSVGSATANASGGAPSYTYSWSPSGATTSTISNLAAGNYTVKVIDSNGCQTTSVTTINGAAGGPTLSITSQTNLNCNGAANGAATINVTTGSGPYTYTWSPSGGNATSANGLSAGGYTVTVGYGLGCTTSTIVNITQPAAISVSLSTTPATCGNYDGTATASASGGNGSLTYLWSVNSNSTTVSGLSAGTYTVVVTDGTGCSVSSSCYVSSSGILSVNAGNGTTIFAGESAGLNGSVPIGSTVVWSPSVSLSCSTCSVTMATPAVTTTYTLSANSGGCIGIDTVTIIVDVKCGEVFVPTAFSPNDDGQNDVLYVYGNCIENMEFVIFDRWGEKVFTSTDPAFGWDGTFNSKKMDPAAFAYYLKATVDGEDVLQKGSISIVK